MSKPPSLLNKAKHNLQKKVNSIIPEKVHKVVTAAIKQMTRAVILGAKYTNPKPKKDSVLEVLEARVFERIKFYSSTAAAEGAVTGAGGFLLGLADFPLWLTIKMKMLFEIASYYGFDTKDYKERIFILYIFQLTFSTQQHRNQTFAQIRDWDKTRANLPDDIHQFDWKHFQLQYRDYIDIAKLLQLIPGVGAVVGAYVNHTLTKKLGNNAMNAYRMRIERDQRTIEK